jgi:hypothetical protein
LNFRLFGLFAASLLLVVVALAILGGWFSPPGKVPTEVAYQESMWVAHRLKAYTLRIERRCECDMRPITSTVRDGSVADARYEAPGGTVALTGADRLHQTLTVERIYDYLTEAYKKRYSKIEISYDPVLHYPKRVYIDRIASALDDEFELLITVSETHGGG